MNQQDLMRFINEGTWKVRWYGINMNLDATVNGVGQNSVQLDSRWFYCEAITHGIMGVDIDAQHGDYLVTFRDDETNYTNIPLMANLMMGNVFQGVALPLSQPRLYRGSQSVIAELQNLTDRTAEYPEGFYPVQIVLKGRERTDLDGRQFPDWMQNKS